MATRGLGSSFEIRRTSRRDLKAIKAANSLADIVGADRRLIKTSSGWKCACPLHPDRSPSFTIFSGGARFRCFGCGAGGDVLDFLQQLHGVGLCEAADMLSNGVVLPVVAYAPPVTATDSQPDTTLDAIDLWRSCAPVRGTPASAYLRRRALTIHLPDCLRFGRIRLGRRAPMPALVALVVGADGRPSGVQRIFLTEDGRKADLRGGKVKFSLGRVGGGAVRIAPPDGELILCEGIEDALSAVELFGQAAWATCGTSNLGSVDLPPEVRSVIIGADADEAGMAAARKAAARYAAQGLTARILKPLDGHKDFNSEINQGAR